MQTSYIPHMSPKEMRARADECERLAESLGPDNADVCEILRGIAEQWRKLADYEKALSKAPWHVVRCVSDS